MNEYMFSFTELNHGSIKIKSVRPPNRDEVIEEIWKGNAHFNQTEYEDIKLCGSKKVKSKPVRNLSR